MNELIIALISGVVTLITSLTSSILVFKGSQKKIHADQEVERRKQMQDQDEKINSMQKNITKHYQLIKMNTLQRLVILKILLLICNLQINNFKQYSI